jgi:proteasome accessory factor B
MKKLTHAARVLRIRELLDSRPYLTVPDLVQRFDVSRRTVYNDLAALQDADVPIYSETRDGETRWMLHPAARRRTVTLSPGQVLPFGLATQALSFLKGTEIHDQLQAIIDRLTEGVSPLTRRQLRTLPRKVALVPHGPKDYEPHADTLDDILTALVYDELLSITYEPPGQPPRPHLIEPYCLLLYREALYLICHTRTFDADRIFAVDRIRSTTRTREKFTYPPDFTPDAFIDGSFGLMGGDPTDVVIDFDPDQARYVMERKWHSTQSFEPQPDGRIRMTMSVAGLVDVYRWLVGHLGTFEVVEPAELRKWVEDVVEMEVST